MKDVVMRNKDKRTPEGVTTNRERERLNALLLAPPEQMRGQGGAVVELKNYPASEGKPG